MLTEKGAVNGVKGQKFLGSKGKVSGSCAITEQLSWSVEVRGAANKTYRRRENGPPLSDNPETVL